VKIVAFYSFKGGVGRTSALLNVAYLLASKRNATVVLADWDVHAPGLTCLYDLQPPDGPRLRPGIVDLLGALAETAPGDDMIDPADLLHPTRLGQRLVKAGRGDLWLVSAGAFDPADETSAYLAATQRLQPKLQGLAESAKDDLVTWFGQRIEAGFRARTGKQLDYLLLDARTGLTEVGELLLSDATEQVVVLFGLNAQNQLGMEQTLRRLTHSFGAANVASRVVLVASPVPAGEEALKARRLSAARSTIERVVEELTLKASLGDANPIVPAAPRLLSIPYHPLLALDEELLTEHYPESDPAVAYGLIEEAVRIRGADALEEATSTAARAVGLVHEEPPEPLPGGVPRGEQPFARLLHWNVVLPEATEDRLIAGAGDLAGPLLEGLANSVSLSPEEKRKLVDSISKSPFFLQKDLLQLFGEQQRKLRELPPNQWPKVAALAGRGWASWALFSARRLGVGREDAARRFLEGRPWQLEGETGTLTTLAALEVLRSAGALNDEALRNLLGRLRDSNADFDFALGAVASMLVESLGDVDAAYPLFVRAAALPPSEASFRLALHVGDAGKRLLPLREREAEALLLLEQAGRHFERALVFKPEMHAAEHTWGLSQMHQARALSGRESEKALSLLDRARQHFERALVLKPDNQPTYGALGVLDGLRHHALLRAGRTTEAQAAAEGALIFARRHGEATGEPSYNLACALSINGFADEALDMLEALHQSGTLGVDAAHIAADADLASLAGHPRFDALLAALRGERKSEQQ
jgi:MinD-like ATPase involved in chromosome partitioning or flagellar assembly